MMRSGLTTYTQTYTWAEGGRLFRLVMEKEKELKEEKNIRSVGWKTILFDESTIWQWARWLRPLKMRHGRGRVEKYVGRLFTLIHSHSSCYPSFTTFCYQSRNWKPTLPPSWGGLEISHSFQGVVFRVKICWMRDYLPDLLLRTGIGISQGSCTPLLLLPNGNNPAYLGDKV